MTGVLQTGKGQTDSFCAVWLCQPLEGFPAGKLVFWFVVGVQFGFFIYLHGK